MQKLLQTILFFCAIPALTIAQINIIPVSSLGNTSTPVLNYIKDPTLNAWGFYCTRNDSTFCYSYTYNTQSNNGIGCPYDSLAFYYNQSQRVLGLENIILSGAQNIIGIDGGFVFSPIRYAFNTNGIILNGYNNINLWKAPQKFVAHSLYGNYFSQCEDSLFPERIDLINTLNNVPGPNGDTTLTWHHGFEFVSGGTYFDLGYVFASDKYDTNIQTIGNFCVPCWMSANTSMGERICGNNNDGIAMFLSGPGINGPYHYNAENIALIPGTNEPVCVRNIHPQLDIAGPCGLPKNTQYFVAGTDSAAEFPFSGFTVPMHVKKIPINPCDTYRINIALGSMGTRYVSIRDGYTGHDGAGASALILEKGSARTGFWQVVTTPLFQGYGIDTLVEGCPGAELTFVRFFNTAQPDSIHLQFQGSAINGLDIDALPEWVYFLPGQDSVSIQVNALFDSVNEGAEEFTIRLMPPGVYPCPVDTTEVHFTIIERPAFQAFMPDTFLFNPCSDASVVLNFDSISGLGPFSFQWADGSSADSVALIPDSSGYFAVTVFDACHADSAVLLPFVFRHAPAPVFQKINDNRVIHCASGNLNLSLQVINNFYPQLSYLWQNGSTDSTIAVNPLYDGHYIYHLQAFLPCAPDTFDFSFDLTVHNDTLDCSAFDIQPNQCPGFTYALFPSVAGGYPNYQFLWQYGSTNDSLFVSPMTTSSYRLTITDQCQIDTDVVEFTVNVPHFDPLRIVGPNQITLPCPTGMIKFNENSFYGIGGTGDSVLQNHYTYSWNNFKSTGLFFERFVTDDTLLVLRMTDRCGNDTAVLNIPIKTFHGPYLKASLQDTLHACVGQEFTFSPTVSDGVKPYGFAWSNNSFKSSLAFVPALPKTAFNVTVTDFCGFTKSASTTVYATAPLANFSATNDAYEPALIHFQNLSDSAVSYQWFFGDGGGDDTQNPSYQYQELKNWEVTLIATDFFGCLDSAIKPLDIPLNLFIPNAFTPDGDGINETWQPLGYGFMEIGYTIFDRWGGVIFHVDRSSDKVTAWDGTANGVNIPTGAYAYVIEVKPFIGLAQQVTGIVNVIRN